MAQSNHERIGQALELLNAGLYPFVERMMQAAYGPRWIEEASSHLRDHQAVVLNRTVPHLDTQILLTIMGDSKHTVFKNVLGSMERAIIGEIREVRNSWAHQKPFSNDDTYRALDSIHRLLIAVSASQQASEVERQKQDLLRLEFEDQARQEAQKITTAPLDGTPMGGLLPWRTIVTPHPDVILARYEMSRFAADLGQVHRGEGADEYRFPRDFFQRTYLTYGLRQLLVQALKRLSGQGGDPVIDLQTNFGGGKTHALLALYHLFSDTPHTDLIGIEPLLREAGVSRPAQVQRTVLVGHALSPSQPRTKPDGCVVKTLWGELAWQLMGRDGYAMVAEADRQGMNPGTDILRDLFTVVAPCLILIDEWVAYAGQLYHVPDSSGGSFDANLSFAQSLTEAVKSTPQTLVVATIPASDIEKGGEGGSEAAVRLKNIFGRVESPWRPADAEEGFEIVRRRLFQDIADNARFMARDTVARAFVNFYREHSQEFPAECQESRYEERIKAAYPIHPELFDRLYNDWSSIEKFQRTRGVLRLMAKVVHRLWESEDKNLLILPASVPIAGSEIKPELTYYLEDNWDPVIEKDVDGSHSLPWRLDSGSSTLGRYSACRRVARTIYLGSAPNLRNPNKGLTEDRIKLGSSQPGESIATFGDALRRLSDQSSHLYQDGQRYWYATQPSVARLAQDRAAQYDDDRVYSEIEKRLRTEEQHIRADFGRVHPCPASSGEIVDDDTALRLVILRPKVAHARNDRQSTAWREAMSILDTRGNRPRINKNTLVFLAADRSRLDELIESVRQYIAWDSICIEGDTLNLDAFGRQLAQRKKEAANDTIKARIPEACTWLLVPEQEKLQPITLLELHLQPQKQPALPLATNASHRLKNEELLITEYAGTRLRRDLDSVPLWRGNHIAVKTLAEYYAQHVYLPRLKNSEVLLGAIRDGVQSPSWERETFAYADSWDEDQQRYLGLKVNQPVIIASTGMVVKPEAAAVQLAADVAVLAQKQATHVPREEAASPIIHEGRTGTHHSGENAFNTTGSPMSSHEVGQPLPSESKRKRRFYGAVPINPRMMASDAGKIMEEVVKHFTRSSRSGVSVTLEIQVSIPEGIPLETQQVVEENCRTLGFESASFEDD